MTNVPKMPFPQSNYGSWSALRTHTVSGLFAYRYAQAIGMMEYPDFTNDPKMKEMLLGQVACHPPLTAVVIFLCVVALEDFVRELGNMLFNVQSFDTYFSNSATLGQKSKTQNAPHARKDDDATRLSDPEHVNNLYKSVFGVQPYPDNELPRLRDLILIRHIVAHHGSTVREIDAERFQYYEVPSKCLLNPTVEFTKETALYIYKIGRIFEENVKKAVFTKIKGEHPSNWKELEITKKLIEGFNWFGKFAETKTPRNISPEGKDITDYGAAWQELIKKCMEDIEKNVFEVDVK